jgi:23S rRNA (guanosine2251-2'-O)-methyltransferase
MNNDNSYIFGKNAVTEAINSGKSIQKIYLCYGADNNRLQILAKKNKIPCTTFDKKKFHDFEVQHTPKMSKTQGVIALLQMIETIEIGDFLATIDMQTNPVVGILDGILDPQNLGAIARSAECAGLRAIILPSKNSAPITPVAIKASAGAISYLPIIETHNLILVVEKLKEAGFWIIAADMNGETRYDSDIYDRPTAIVIGSEGKGLSPSVRKHCDYIVSIPMRGKINSLNASVTAGILFFEATK